MAATTLPPNAANAATAALTSAMAEASISSSPASSTKPLDDGASSLEDGEIRDNEEDGEEEDDDDEVDDGRVKTVFDDSRKFNVKHPLYSRWTLYFDSPQSKLLPKTPSQTPASPGIAHGGWMDDIRKVVTFDSVEEFWGLYNNIVPPSQLPGKANYYLFKDGIMPAWEDAQNKNGGKWSIQVPRDKSKSVIDKMWMYTMLAAIGETFETSMAGGEEKAVTQGEYSDLVTGVIMQSRPMFYRINVWTRQAPDTDLPDTDALMGRIKTIGTFFKGSILGYNDQHKLVAGSLQTEVTFESHADSEKKGNKRKIIA